MRSVKFFKLLHEKRSAQILFPSGTFLKYFLEVLEERETFHWAVSSRSLKEIFPYIYITQHQDMDVAAQFVHASIQAARCYGLVTALNEKRGDFLIESNPCLSICAINFQK